MENREKNTEKLDGNRVLGEHVDVDEKDLFSLEESDLLVAGEKILENIKENNQALNRGGVSQDKKEGLSEFFHSNEILNEIRAIKNIIGIQKIEDWKYLNKDIKKERLKELGISIPQNNLSKLSYKLIPGEETRWIDEKFFGYVKNLTDRYEIITKTEIKNKNA